MAVERAFHSDLFTALVLLCLGTYLTLLRAIFSDP